MATGLNAKLAMATDVVATGFAGAAAGDAGGVVGDGAAAAAGGAELPHAEVTSPALAATATSSERIVGPDTSRATGRVTARRSGGEHLDLAVAHPRVQPRQRGRRLRQLVLPHRAVEAERRAVAGA